MQKIVLDFETYYDKQFRLNKLQIDEYVTDPRFKIHGVGLKINDDKPIWWSGREVLNLREIAWDRTTAVFQNAYFDAFILSYWFKVKPAVIRDTMSMGRALFGPDVSNSLAALAERLGIGKKGNELIITEGKRDLTQSEMQTLGNYCAYNVDSDVNLTSKVYDKLLHDFPESELELIDIFVRLFTEPAIRVNKERLQKHLEKVVADKRKAVEAIKHLLPPVSSIQGFGEVKEIDWLEEAKPHLMSNDKFAELLRMAGADIPKKISKRTGKETLALSKQDEDFNELLQSPNPNIQALAKARLSLKSTLDETRAESLITKSVRPLPFQLLYYGAHTGRASGAGGINPQNFPRGGEIRKSLEAPDGCVLCVADLSQIEARMNMWLAWKVFGGNDGCRAGLDTFATNGDIYSEFATKFYGRTITKKNKVERFVGKTSVLGLGYQMGAPRLQWQLKVSESHLDMPIDECKKVVELYRETYWQIPKQWYALGDLILFLSNGKQADYGVVKFDGKKGILLPNGLYIKYRGLAIDDKGAWSYLTRKSSTVDEHVHIYGGKVTENIIQALARLVVTDAMLKISKRYKIVLQVHDEIVFIAPEKEAQEALDWAINIMCETPSWADKGLPLAAEGGFAKEYSK